MPFVNIRITRENGEPTKEQKEELIEGVTELLARVLGRANLQVWLSSMRLIWIIMGLVARVSRKCGVGQKQRIKRYKGLS